MNKKLLEQFSNETKIKNVLDKEFPLMIEEVKKSWVKYLCSRNKEMQKYCFTLIKSNYSMVQTNERNFTQKSK